MKKLALILCALSTVSFAETQKAKINMELNVGDLTFKPEVIVKLNERASITEHTKSGNLEISVQAKERKLGSNPAVDMKFTIARVNGTKREIISSPRIISLWGKTSVLQEVSESTKTPVNLKVIASPQK